jgi:hypothetical protein
VHPAVAAPLLGAVDAGLSRVGILAVRLVAFALDLGEEGLAAFLFSPFFEDRSRSQVEGDSRLGANKVWHHLGDLAARGSKASPKMRR